MDKNTATAKEQGSGYYSRLAALVARLIPADVSSEAIDKAPKDQLDAVIMGHDDVKRAIIDVVSRHIVEQLSGDTLPKLTASPEEHISDGGSEIVAALNNTPNRTKNLANENIARIIEESKKFARAEAERIKEGIAVARTTRPSLGAFTGGVISTSDVDNRAR